jgi:hypothetical protein
MIGDEKNAPPIFNICDHGVLLLFFKWNISLWDDKYIMRFKVFYLKRRLALQFFNVKTFRLNRLRKVGKGPVNHPVGLSSCLPVHGIKQYGGPFRFAGRLFLWRFIWCIYK